MENLDSLVKLKDVIILLDEYAEQFDAADLNLKPTRKPTHGACCTCHACGHYHDECVCTHNEVITMLIKMEKFKENKNG